MDRTAAQRQARFRQRMRALGYKVKTIWIDDAGFPGRGPTDRPPLKPELTREEFEEELTRAVSGTDSGFRARFYGELAAYIRGLRGLWEYRRQNPELWTPEELENSAGKV